MSEFDPTRAARIDKKKKEARTSKKLDYRYMNDYDDDDFNEDIKEDLKHRNREK